MAERSRRSLSSIEGYSNISNLVPGIGKAARGRRSLIPKPLAKRKSLALVANKFPKAASKNGESKRPLNVVSEQSEATEKKGGSISHIESTSNVTVVTQDTEKEPKPVTKKCRLLIAIAEKTKSRVLSIDQEVKHSALVSPFPLPENVMCIDDPDDSTACYAVDFMGYLSGLERAQMINATLSMRTLQDKRPLETRLLVSDWLIEVAHYFKTSQETLYQSINLLDKVLSGTTKLKIGRKDLQLLSVVSLYIASKLEEYFPVEVNELVRLTEHSWNVEEIMKMELAVLDATNFKVQTVEPMPFLNRFISAARLSLYQNATHSPIEDRKFYELCILLIDCTISSYKAWEMLPSEKAAASVYAALCVFVLAFPDINPISIEDSDEVFRYDVKTDDVGERDSENQLSQIWNATLVHYSGYSESEIQPLSHQMLDKLLKLKKNVDQDEIDVEKKKRTNKVNSLKVKYLSSSRHCALLKSSQLQLSNIESAAEFVKSKRLAKNKSSAKNKSKN